MANERLPTYSVKLRKLLIRSRLALGSTDAPDMEFFDGQTAEFLEILDKDLPENRLEEVYTKAMSMKKGTFPLAVVELNEAWRTIKGAEYKPHIYQCLGCQMVAEGSRKACPYHPNKTSVQAESTKV